MKLICTALAIALAGGLAAGAPAARAEQITGAGATFPAPVYSAWGEAAKQAAGIELNYQAIGSGGGQNQILNRTVDFGASDAPMAPDKLESGKLLQFPTVIGAVVPIVNIPGVKPGQLKLTGELLAAIYLGQITKWNDPKLVEMNSGVKLPSSAIAPVYRADGSGTTFVFTSYLSAVEPAWKEKVGASTSVKWVVGNGAKGNDGVAATGASDARRHRLRGIRLCREERPDHHAAAQQSRELRRPDAGDVRRRRHAGRLGGRQELRRQPDRPARR